jgi:hypothetical protein
MLMRQIYKIKKFLPESDTIIIEIDISIGGVAYGR